MNICIGPREPKTLIDLEIVNQQPCLKQIENDSRVEELNNIIKAGFWRKVWSLKYNFSIKFVKLYIWFEFLFNINGILKFKLVSDSTVQFMVWPSSGLNCNTALTSILNPVDAPQINTSWGSLSPAQLLTCLASYTSSIVQETGILYPETCNV